ncbi:MAG: AraC family transcriptional regulator [Pseudomonas sp.]|uniref:AraC-like transcriptional regulator QhpR n=1 Tax=Pseudomonas sp. TaxID=306 RepID=UPI003982C89F
MNSPAPSTAGVLASAASGLIDFILQEGGDAERILGHSGIDPEQLNTPTLQLDLNQYCTVFEVAARQTGNDNFGLRFGQQFKPDSLGMLGYVGLCSANLGQALRNVVRMFPYHQQGSLLHLIEMGDYCRLDYQVQHGSVAHKRQDAELSLGMFNNLMRQALGPHWAPEQVLFEHAQPQAWHEHCKTFDAPVLFNQPRNALVFPRRLLDKPMPGRDPKLLTLMLEAMPKLSRPLDAQKSLLDDVKHLLRQRLGEDDISLEGIAEQLRLPAWTLQRRLADQGTSFSNLLDQIRRELATHYLQRADLAISELALQLGYSEISAFSRAFRRWFAISPQQWRQNQGSRQL